MTRDPNAEAYKVLRGFWTRFRRFVKGQLVAHYGSEWEEEGLPESIRNSCTKHRDDRDPTRRGGWVSVEAESLLDFAFDEHLREIIEVDANWNGIFKHFFGANKSLINGDLHRICLVRDEVAHWRPVTWKQVRELRAWCEGITGCVARAATIRCEWLARFPPMLPLAASFAGWRVGKRQLVYPWCPSPIFNRFP